jgi:glutamate-1-semialdehyde 2,1-aminomutase
LKTIAIVQARMGSIRFPNKVMRSICGTPMIGLLLNRLSNARLINQIVLATSKAPCNDSLVKYVQELSYTVFRGSEDDVLDRYYHAAKEAEADSVVRITGDCPLVDPVLVDEVITKYLDAKVDYVSNAAPPTFPDGLDIEVFSFQALEVAWSKAKTSKEREHVTPFIRESGKFSQANFANDVDCSEERWTVDESEDFEVVQKVFEHFHPSLDFSWLNVLDLNKKHPEWFASNRHLARNQGAELGTGQKLWKRAKKIIPGGNMLLSKRPEMLLPGQWPAYFSKAKGCKVWDLDGKEYIDMSMMGIGTNTLGYGHPEVDDAVSKVVGAGNMSTLNCPEEVYLAEKLIELHPWADMARFARSGGEANAIAIRIARAATGKDKVAICGYHGWHDWYLSANLSNDKNLDGHLLPGLDPKGVPRNLQGSVLAFNYNNYAELELLVSNHDIGTIMMEVQRDKSPEDDFLQKVRQLATEHNIVLIFDECSSGFRQTYGGIHKMFGVDPDMAVFGKALGNGYAITAVIGRREIMESAQTTFISSTFWTERIGSVAALKTLEVMERVKSWKQITKSGLKISAKWKDMSSKHGLTITTRGIPAFAGFSFNSDNALAYNTLIAQEMLKQGYLAGTSVYGCIEHTEEIIDGYFEALDPLFKLIRECEDGRNINSLLNGPTCHDGFKRLT